MDSYRRMKTGHASTKKKRLRRVWSFTLAPTTKDKLIEIKRVSGKPMSVIIEESISLHPLAIAITHHEPNGSKA